MWQRSSEQQAELIARTDSALDYTKILAMINLLRADGGAPAALEQRLLVRTMCAQALGKNIDGQRVALVQADGASSLGVPGTRIAHWTTWSLAEDYSMVRTPEMVKETGEDPQYQFWFGKTRGQPVLTGMATTMFNWMVQSSRLDSPCGPFHANDAVPATSLLTNEKLSTGCYRESPNQAGLERFFEDTTVGFYVDNLDYAALCPQGKMGARLLASQCKRRGVELTRASSDFYELFNLSESQASFTTSAAQTFGVRFLGNGRQLACMLPSLGSALAGPASGGGAEAVVSATNLANVLRALRGVPPIKLEDSPLAVFRTGKDRTAAHAAELLKVMDARGAMGWKHPSQIGGAPSHETRPATPAVAVSQPAP